MPFNSLPFLLLFLPIVVIGARLLRDHRSTVAAQAWVVAASLVFYGWGRPVDLSVLVASILFNAIIGHRMTSAPLDSPARGRWLALGLIGNVGVLCLFKYTDFLFPGAHAVHAVAVMQRAIPLGISFYTLMQITYLVDCHDGVLPASSLFQHAAFVSFFPHLTAGPIDRATTFVPQWALLASKELRWQKTGQGLVLLAIGLVKKVVIADAFARIADAGYGAVGRLSTIEAWATACSFTFQLYFDLSGYTDMALGSALLLGISLTKNFNAPYRATSIGDFWRRWHISLSTFITRYLYTPIVTPIVRRLGHSTIHAAAAAIVLAMTIIGLWHGAAWTFVLFGLMHGVALAVNQYWKRLRRPLRRSVGWMVTFGFVNLAFVVFRAPTIAGAFRIFRDLVPHRSLLSLTKLSLAFGGDPLIMILGPVLIGGFIAFGGPTSDEIASRLQWTPRMALGASVMFLLGLLYLNSSAAREFVYFRF